MPASRRCISTAPRARRVEKAVGGSPDLSPGIVRFYFDSRRRCWWPVARSPGARVRGARAGAGDATEGHAQVQALRLLIWTLYLDANAARARCRCGTRSGARPAPSRSTSTSAARRTRTSPCWCAGLIRRADRRERGRVYLDAGCGVSAQADRRAQVPQRQGAFQSRGKHRPCARSSVVRWLSAFGVSREFAPPPRPPRTARRRWRHSAQLPARAYADPRCRRARTTTAPGVAGRRGTTPELARGQGDYLSGDLGGERVLIVRAERGRLHAF